MHDTPILCIVGPTASGKTATAIELTRSLDAELISVDSALVYRGLDIGSAKPAFPHHLVDICDPAEAYSAARFADDARQAIAQIRDRGRVPILVGGTMLYFRALFEGLAAMPPADPALRATLEARAAREGWPALHAELQRVDPESAARIHPNHSQRLLRALEVFELTGSPIVQLQREGRKSGQTMPALWVAIAPWERSVLHRRIELRFAQMMADGFLEEVRGLYQRGDLHAALPAIRAVGYRQLWAHIDGEYTLPEAVNKGIAATRQLAKRQFTWLRKWPDLHWVHTDADGAAVSHDLSLTGASMTVGGGNIADLVLNYLRSNPM